MLILGAWLAGATRPATAVRRVSAPYLREPAIAYGVFAVVAAAVVLWWAPTPAMRNPVMAILLVVLFAAGFEGLRRRTAREFPDADRHEFQQRTRERLARSYESVRERTASGGAAVARRTSALRSEPAGEGSPTPPASDPRIEQLERLSQLRTTGVLDEQEFRAEKARILGDTGDTGDTGDAPVAPQPAGGGRRFLGPGLRPRPGWGRKA